MPLSCAEGSIQPTSLSSPVFSDLSLSLPNALPREPYRENKRKRGPGRPPTARQLWQQPAMQRRLIRLYLYTDESTLNTKQISHLISAIANLDGESKRPRLSSAGINVNSKVRSTQNELQRLFQGNYRDLRPRSREEAHERVETFRYIRHGRVNRDRRPRKPHIPNSSESTKSFSGSFSTPEVIQLTPDISGTYPEPVIPGGIPVVCHSLFDDSSNYLESVESIDAAGSKQQHEPEESTSREHVRLSWVRENPRSISGSICSSRACAEIRSLLSRLSSRSSRHSLDKAPVPEEDPTLSALKGISVDNANTDIIRLCCQPKRTRGETCIHRKFLMTVQKHTLPPELGNNGLDDQCFTGSDCRDIWNQTALHLAAKWAPNEVALRLLSDFLDKYRNPATILNIKSLEGKTFMHIVAERWYCFVPQSGITLASFCSKVVSLGYIFTQLDGNGRTFFDCFLSALENLDMITSLHNYQVNEDLRSLLELQSEREFRRITHTKKPIPVFQPWVWFFDNLSTVLSAKADTEDENGSDSFLEQEHLESDVIPQSYGYNPEGKTWIMALIEIATTCELDQREEMWLNACLEYQADLQLVDRDGNTALHYAVRAQLPMVASRLIAHGIDVGARNLNGKSAFHLATMSYYSISHSLEPDETGTRYARAQSILVRLFNGPFRKREQQKHGKQTKLNTETILQMWDLLQQHDTSVNLLQQHDTSATELEGSPVTNAMAQPDTNSTVDDHSIY
ncbi:ankyrin [Nemania abortiva]|nr:ankyrin [Nemania abortiva]